MWRIEKKKNLTKILSEITLQISETPTTWILTTRWFFKRDISRLPRVASISPGAYRRRSKNVSWKLDKRRAEISNKNRWDPAASRTAVKFPRRMLFREYSLWTTASAEQIGFLIRELCATYFTRKRCRWFGSRKSAATKAADCRGNRITSERTLQICHSVNISSECFVEKKGKERDSCLEFCEIVFIEFESLVVFRDTSIRAIKFPDENLQFAGSIVYKEFFQFFFFFARLRSSDYNYL